MRYFTSLIASSVLALGLGQDIEIPLQNTNYQAYVERDNIIQSHVKMICNIVYEINDTACKDIIRIKQNRTLNKSEKQHIEKILQTLDKVIYISKQKKENEYDKKVYYSSLALKSLLEALISNRYMEVIGNFNALNDDFDCIEYGKNVHNVDKLLNA